MTRVAAMVGCLTAGCYAAPPLPVDPSMLPACSAGSYGVLGTEPCSTDEDCAPCTSAGGNTRPIARARLAALGAACAGPTSTTDVACCERRCTLLSSGALF